VLYWLHAFRVTKVVDTWKLLRTNVGHTLALERARRSSLRDTDRDDINEERNNTSLQTPDVTDDAGMGDDRAAARAWIQ